MTNAKAEPNIDLEYCHARLMAALNGIQTGKGLADHVRVPTSFGKTTKIFNALQSAAPYLKEPFEPDQLPSVDRAYTRFGITRRSNQKSTIAKEMLNILMTYQGPGSLSK